VIDCEEGTHAVEDKVQLLRGASSVCIEKRGWLVNLLPNTRTLRPV
jgi:hypothetical protein